MTTFTFPGVYVEEVPSGVRAITGVTTSDTAFVDYFRRGRVDTAVRCTSFADFERRFGGLDAKSEASYAIRQFFLNGGAAAWVVRVLVGENNEAARAASVALPGGTQPKALVVTAADPGTWGNALRVGVAHVRPPEGTVFDLVVRELDGDRIVATEMFRGLDAARATALTEQVNALSALVRVEANGGVRPDATAARDEDEDEDGSDDENESTDKTVDELGEADVLALTNGADGAEPGSNTWLGAASTALVGSEADGTGLQALRETAPFVVNLVCLPAAAELGADAWKAVYTDALALCRELRAFLLVDPQALLNTFGGVQGGSLDDLRDPNAAVFFPRLSVADPLNGNRPRPVAASGTVAGVFARTDATRGVFKAAAGTTDGALRGAAPTVTVTDRENGVLNVQGINVLRTFPIVGPVVWGARTLVGSDALASEWKYVPVRRTALFLEESLFQGLRFAVFEPNGEPLWAQIRLTVGTFLQGLFRRGAFAGVSAREAFFVKCDAETTTQADIDRGVVNILVGFAPLKPAEFVVLRIQQLAGQQTA